MKYQNGSRLFLHLMKVHACINIRLYKLLSTKKIYDENSTYSQTLEVGKRRKKLHVRINIVTLRRFKSQIMEMGICHFNDSAHFTQQLSSI